MLAATTRGTPPASTSSKCRRASPSCPFRKNVRASSRRTRTSSGWLTRMSPEGGNGPVVQRPGAPRRSLSARSAASQRPSYRCPEQDASVRSSMVAARLPLLLGARRQPPASEASQKRSQGGCPAERSRIRHQSILVFLEFEKERRQEGGRAAKIARPEHHRAPSREELGLLRRRTPARKRRVTHARQPACIGVEGTRPWLNNAGLVTKKGPRETERPLALPSGDYMPSAGTRAGLTAPSRHQ